MRPEAVMAGGIDNGDLPLVPAFTLLARLGAPQVHMEASILHGIPPAAWQAGPAPERHWP